LSTLGEFATPGGHQLALREWAAAGRPHAVVQLVHGLGEHANRYAHVAQRLNALGFTVRGHDHFGHGASSGARGDLPEGLRLVEDLGRMVDETRRLYPGLPLVLLGHSLGGLVAASFVARAMRPVEALVLSSPALDPGLTRLQRGLIAVLSQMAPGLRVGNGLNARYLSHDPLVVQAYQGDPLTHDRIGARLARYLVDEGAVVQAAAPRWRVPTLLLFAGDDRLVNPEGSRRFAAAATDAVHAVCYETLYHELFNEREAQPVFAQLEAWLAARFPVATPLAAG